MWLKILTMLRLRENENNVCIFFMEKKLTSYLVPIIFLPAHPFFYFQIWAWTETWTLWHFCIFMHLTITLSNPYWGKIVSSELSFTWKKNYLCIYHRIFFLPAHPSFFLLTTVLITCPMTWFKSWCIFPPANLSK